MGACSQTNVPVLNTEEPPCGGSFTPTTCIVQQAPLIALGFPLGNALLSDVLVALTLALNNQNTLITNLTTQLDSLQNHVTILQNQVNGCCN